MLAKLVILNYSREMTIVIIIGVLPWVWNYRFQSYLQIGQCTEKFFLRRTVEGVE